jgi:hypothetical protein
VAAEASPRCDLIIVPDAQRAPAARIGKREMVLGLEPDALITRKRLKDLALQRLCRVSWLQCFSRKIETFETFGFPKMHFAGSGDRARRAPIVLVDAARTKRRAFPA